MTGHAGIGKDLLQNSTTADSLANQYGSNAAGINQTLSPALTQEAINPQGYSPTQMAAQTTAAEQTAGGENAGAAGGAMLRAARTRNIGAAPAEIGASNRAGSQELSQINAGIQSKNADLQQRQRQQGLSGLESMYGENVGAGEQALGQSTSALNDAGHLANFWQQLLSQQLSNGLPIPGAGGQ